LENIALVRDADQDRLVNGYWCVEVYSIDKRNIIWPVILWPTIFAALAGDRF
jgi:hypothetical protein